MIKLTKMTVSEKTLAIRAAAGNPNTVCPTCGREPSVPYRSYDDRGNIALGCVDAIHTGHLVGKAAAWHDRPDAVEVRRRTLATLRLCNS